jgi:hypothetical protein
MGYGKDLKTIKIEHPDVSELQSQLAQKATQSELEIERARITNLATLSAGSTTGDAELIDGRVGADGITYANIGSAVRSQIIAVNTEVFDYETTAQDISTWQTGYVTQDGTTTKVNITGFEGYEYGTADVTAGETLKLTFYEVNGYNIFFTNGTTFVSKTYLVSSNFKQITDYEITIPVGVNKIIVNSVKNKNRSIIRDVTTKSSKIYNIEQEIDNIKNNLPTPSESANEVHLWGDSLTDGSGSTSGNDYPSKLQALLGSSYTVKNYGLAGEGCRKIAARRGAVPYYVEPFTIPASGSVAGVVVKDWEGTTVSNLFMRGGQFDATWYSLSKFAINPVSINGVLGNLKQTASGASSYTFERLETGSELALTRPTLLSTYGNRLSENYVDVYWMGTNDSTSPNNYAFMIQYIKYMVERNDCNDRYIVIGLTSKQYDSTIESDNDKIRSEFGRHFLDVRKYLMAYGLQDAGLTPTTDDTNAIASGSVPPSLMKTDLVHFNDYGYNIIANQVHKKGIELGYW